MKQTRKETQKRLFQSSISFISCIKMDGNMYEMAIINKYINDCSPKSSTCGVYTSDELRYEIIRLYSQDTAFCIKGQNEYDEIKGILKQQFKPQFFFTSHSFIKVLFADNKSRKEARILFDDLIKHYFVNPIQNQSNVEGKNAQQCCESFSDCIQYVLQKKGYEINNSYIISGCQYTEKQYSYEDVFLMCKIVYVPTGPTHYFYLDKVKFNKEKNSIEVIPSDGGEPASYYVDENIGIDKIKILTKYFQTKMENIKGIIYCSEEMRGVVERIFVEKNLILKNTNEYFDLILHGCGKYSKYCNISDIQKVRTALIEKSTTIEMCVKELNNVLKNPREYQEICLLPTIPKRQKDYPSEKSDWNHFIFCYHEEEQMLDSTISMRQK